MRVWILSDLHRSPGAGEWTPPAIPPADLAVVAGDVGEDLAQSIAWIATHIRPHMRVVMVAGDHELHGGVPDRQIADVRSDASRHDIHLLERDSVEIDGIRFAGCSLAAGQNLDEGQRRPAAIDVAPSGASDHHPIATTEDETTRPLAPEDAANLHRRSVAFLDRAWRRDVPLVVVTHHAPSARSLDADPTVDPLRPAFASGLDDLVERLGAALWVHGHVHASADYRIGTTRVICNPRGDGGQNEDFDPALVIDVSGLPAVVTAPNGLQDRADLDDIPDEYADGSEYTLDAILGMPLLGRPGRSATASTNSLAMAALQAAMKPGELRRIREGAVALVVQVPGPDWVEPIRHACGNLAEWSAVFARSGASRLEDKPEKGGHQVASELARGRCVLGVSHAPDRHLPAVLANGADLRLAVPVPSNRVIAEVIGKATGSRPRRLPPGLASGLGYDEICAAIRPGRARDCVRRLEAAKAAKCVVDPAVNSAAPFETLAGYGDAHRWGLRFLSDLQAVREGRLDPSEMSRHMVMASAPGLGKSSYVRSLARSAGLPLISTSVAQWFATSTGYLDGVIKAIDATFNAARAYPEGAIIFLDELDAVPSRSELTGKDSSWWTPVVTHLLLTLDGLITEAERVCVIGATNHVERLDAALVRPGRLDKVFYIEPPDADALAAILRHHLASDLADLDLHPMAELGLGATGAVVAAWVKGARARARAAGREIRAQDLLSEIAPEDERRAEDLRRAALHESGHAIAVTVLAIAQVDQVSLVARGGSGGMMHATGLAASAPTRSQMEMVVIGLLSGRAAEAVFLDEPSGGGGGSRDSDLARATAILADLHGSLGLGESLLYQGGSGTLVDRLAIAPALSRAVEADLTRLYEQAVRLIGRHRHSVERLAEVLMARRLIDGEEVRRIVSGAGLDLAPDLYEEI
jgi:cell division protease FtsH